MPSLAWQLAFVLLAGTAAAWPLLRASASPQFRAAFPLLTRIFAVTLAAAALFAIAVALVLAGLLPWLTFAAAFAAGFLWWRSRPSYGTSRGLPPGSLALLPLEAWTDSLFYQKQAERFGPIFKMSHFFHPMVCIMGLDHAIELLREHDDVSLRSPKHPFSDYLPCGILRGMPVEQHKHYRGLIQVGIRPEIFRAGEPWIETAIREALTTIAAQPAGVFPEPYLQSMIFRVFVRLFFGLEPGSPAHREFEAAAAAIRAATLRPATLRWMPSHRRVLRALDRTHSLLLEQRAQWDRAGAAPPCFFAEIARSHPEAAADPALTGNLIFLVHASSVDLMGLAQWLLAMLIDHPEWIEPIRAEAATTPHDENGIANRFIRETLRLQQSEHIYRQVLRDIHFQDMRIPKGWLLRIGVRESHRSPAVFPHPEAFQPDRFLDPHPPKSAYSPFGFLRRACIGEQLTRFIARVYLYELLCGFDLRLAARESEDFRGWHWTPGSAFRVALQPRPAAAIPRP
jgi:cytochrome P450